MKNKKRFLGTLSFNQEEISSMNIQLNAVGISMPVLTMPKEQAGYTSTRDWLSFGWMGNDPKFYKDVQANDIMPKREDFIEVPFRLISATVVGGGSWKAADFSNVDVLKPSTMMLEGKTVYKDHETDMDNWVGLVTGVKWTESFVDTATGITVPAGIDGMIAIDAKTNPKTARGVLGGMIYSNSVTVEFEYEMSHHFENEWDFIERVGTFGSDGKMIRRLVKKIVNYHESSLVWLGADPFAKAIKTEGEGLKNIDIGSVYQFAKSSCKGTVENKITIAEETDKIRETVKNNKKLTINFALDEKILSLAKRNELQNEQVMNKFLLAFMVAFGKDLGLTEESVANLSDAQIQEALGKVALNKPEFAGASTNAQLISDISTKALDAFKASNEANKEATTVDLKAFMEDFAFVPATRLVELEGVETEKVTLAQEKEVLETANASLTVDATIGKEYIGMKRTEAIRLYKEAVGIEKADAAVVSLFEKADSAAVDGLLTQYTKAVTHKFGGQCAKCQSTEFQFRSTLDVIGKEEGGKTEQLAVDNSGSYEDIQNRYNRSAPILGGKLDD